MSSLTLQKLRISVKAYESNILDNACVEIIDAVKASGIGAVGPIPLPTKDTSIKTLSDILSTFVCRPLKISSHIRLPASK